MAVPCPGLLVAVVAVLLPQLLSSGFGLSLLCRMGIAIVFALSFNMLLGQGGMLDFGHAVFLGFGGFAAMHAMRAAGDGWPGSPRRCCRWSAPPAGWPPPCWPARSPPAAARRRSP